MNKQEAEYALAKQLDSMENGINTSYGFLEFTPEMNAEVYRAIHANLQHLAERAPKPLSYDELQGAHNDLLCEVEELKAKLEELEQ